MDNRKRIVNLEYFKEMMYICPRLHGQTFDELPFEEEIMAFLRFLRHSGKIRKLADVNINKLHQPWRSFAAKNVDFAYLLWEDFVYQVEHKDVKKSNEMYYPKFTKVIIHYFITKDSSIPRRNKFDVMLPIELTNEDIRNYEAYKEYYAVASGDTPPKTKASIKKTKSSSDTTITPPTAAGTSIIPGVPDVPTEESDEEISWKSSDEDDDDDDQDDDDQDDNDDDQDIDNDDDDFVHPKLSIHDEETKDEESFDLIDAEDDNKELYRDININLEGREMADVHTIQEFKDTHVTLTLTTPRVDVQASTTVASLTLIALTIHPPTIPTTQAKNEEFPKNLDENIQKIIKEQVKEQVKKATSLSIDLMSKRNLYKALVDAYESDEIILDTYGDTVTLKRRRDDVDKDEEPSVGSDQGSKRQREGKKPESTSAPKEKATKTTGKPTQGSKSRQKTASKSAPAEEPMQKTQDLEEPSHQVFETGVADDQPITEAFQHPECDLAKQANSRSSFNELMDTPVDFLAFLMNRLKVDTLTLELLVGPIYELMKGLCKSLVELEFFLEEVYKATTDQLDWNNPEGQQYPHNLLKPLPLIPNSRGKLTNLTVKERFAFNVSLRMFTTSIVIQRRVEDLQLGVKSYQKKLNLTKPDTYRFDLKRKEAYIAYSNTRGFIYQNKDKQNRLMQIDELHKFSDGTLNDVRTALDDRLNGIRMKYLPQAIWRKSDKERATAMIQAIDKQLKTRRIMQSLEKFVGGRLYEGDFRWLQRTI
nr:hypothetical protein [Tanacetum cinerariifolium]